MSRDFQLPLPVFYFKKTLSLDLMLSHIQTVVVCLHLDTTDILKAGIAF